MAMHRGKKSAGRKTARRHHKRGGARRTAKKGGMALGALIKQALVPFGLFAAQRAVKKSQKNRK